MRAGQHCVDVGRTGRIRADAIDERGARLGRRQIVELETGTIVDRVVEREIVGSVGVDVHRVDQRAVGSVRAVRAARERLPIGQQP